jgi:hypothetical protein
VSLILDRIEVGAEVKVLHGPHAGKTGDVQKIEGRFATVDLGNERVSLALSSLRAL